MGYSCILAKSDDIFIKHLLKDICEWSFSDKKILKKLESMASEKQFLLSLL